MVTVYKIGNTVNDKLYIGVTKHSLRKRFGQHIKDSKDPKKQHRPFFAAINEIGIEKFFIESIEEIPDDLREERERYWIAYYNTCEQGYNATYGGEGRPETFGKIDFIIQTYLDLQNITETAKATGFCMDTISAILKEHNIPIKSTQQIQRDRARNVYMCTKQGEVLKEFDSASAAADYVKTLNTKIEVDSLRYHISQVCRGIRKTAAGYVWKYVDEQ